MDRRELRQELFRVGHQFHRVKKLSFFDKIPQGEMLLMMQVGRYARNHPGESGISVSQIAQNQGSSMQLVCRTLRGMEQKGYIERQRGRRDRRNTEIVLTEYGWKLHDEVTEHMDQMMDRVMDKFGEENTLQLINLLRQFIDVMQEETAREQENPQTRKAWI